MSGPDAAGLFVVVWIGGVVPAILVAIERGADSPAPYFLWPLWLGFVWPYRGLRWLWRRVQFVDRNIYVACPVCAWKSGTDHNVFMSHVASARHWDQATGPGVVCVKCGAHMELEILREAHRRKLAPMFSREAVEAHNEQREAMRKALRETP